MLCDGAQILETVAGALHGIVAQIVISQTYVAEIVVVPVVAVIISRIAGFLAEHFRKRFLLLGEGLGSCDVAVEPADGEIVVLAQAVVHQPHALVPGLC